MFIQSIWLIIWHSQMMKAVPLVFVALGSLGINVVLILLAVSIVVTVVTVSGEVAGA